jgi:hypothetical protein
MLRVAAQRFTRNYIYYIYYMRRVGIRRSINDDHTAFVGERLVYDGPPSHSGSRNLGSFGVQEFDIAFFYRLQIYLVWWFARR